MVKLTHSPTLLRVGIWEYSSPWTGHQSIIGQTHTSFTHILTPTVEAINGPSSCWIKHLLSNLYQTAVWLLHLKQCSYFIAFFHHVFLFFLCFPLFQPWTFPSTSSSQSLLPKPILSDGLLLLEPEGNAFISPSSLPSQLEPFVLFCIFCLISFQRWLILKGGVMCFGFKSPVLSEWVSSFPNVRETHGSIATHTKCHNHAE